MRGFNLHGLPAGRGDAARRSPGTLAVEMALVLTARVPGFFMEAHMCEPKPSASTWRMKDSKSAEAKASDKVGEKSSFNVCPLVMIEWEDSAQPIPNWSYLASFEAPGTIRCVSVGWLIRDDGQMMALAPNMGAIDDENSVQVSGVIQIPTRCVLKTTHLSEPTV